MFRTVLGIVALFALIASATAETPVVPGQNVNLWTLFAFAASAIYICGLMWIRQRRQSPAKRRIQQVSGNPIYFEALLTLLFHVGRNDGVISKDNLEAIRSAYRHATGAEVTPEMTASHFARFTTDASVFRLIGGYRGVQAETMLDAAILAATQNGCVPREKETFLTELSIRLEAKGEWFDRSLASALCPKTSATQSGREIV